MLKNLLSRFIGKAEEPVTVSPVPEGVADSILGIVGARSIPPMVGSAQKAFRVAIDPKTDARDFIEVLESDESLSARIIRVANSVYFDRGKKSTSIEEAVQVIGLNELRGILNASSLNNLFASKHPAREIAWNNDIATAIIAKTITQRCCPDLTDSAFLAGLMHDIGKLLLIQRVGEEYSKIIKVVEHDGIPFHEAEAMFFPFDHTEVGLLIAERWQFTTELKDAIRNHHQDFKFFNSLTLPGIVKASDMIAYIIGTGGKSANRLRLRYEENSPEIFDYLGIPYVEQKEFLQNITKTYELEADLYRSQK